MHTDSTALHRASIRSQESADIALAHAPDLGISQPHTVDAIDRDFLQSVLAADVAGAVLESVSVTEGHDGMTSRRAWSLQWNETGQKAELPPAIFAKATPEEPYHRETLALLHMGENEVNFYTQLQPELPDIAPKAYYARSYPGGRYILLTEDLKVRDLRPYWLADKCSLEHAKAVASAQAQFHAKYWNSERFESDLVWVRPRSRRFGGEWHMDSMVHARSTFLDSEQGQALPEKARSVLKKYNDNFSRVLDYWDTKPPTLLHGDSHLGNTFSYPDGRAGYFDWQLNIRGYGIRDLTFFMMSALDNDSRVAYEREIFAHYIEELKRLGVDIDHDDAWNDHCIYMLDSWDGAIKTLVRGGYGHAPDAIARQLECAVHAVLEHDVESRLDAVLK